MADVGAGHVITGAVVHARMRPVFHKLNYRVFSLLMDVDRLEEVDKALKHLIHPIHFTILNPPPVSPMTTCPSEFVGKY